MRRRTVDGRSQVIPRLIHQLWIDPAERDDRGRAPPAGMPAAIERRCTQWRLLDPAFHYRLWSLEEVESAAAGDDAIGGRACAALRCLRIPAAQADVARLLLLRMFGGFWVDLKLVPGPPFLSSLEDLDLVLTEHFPQVHRPEPKGFLAGSFIGSDRNTAFIDSVLRRVLDKIERRVQASIFDLTGPRNLLEVQIDMMRTPEALGRYTVLPYTETWKKLFSLGAAPYNDNGMHWSIRERREPIYVDN
jgi:mannosyltransferase OCH1-like enzyme